MATNSREARRRKIVERGSDRLALITGRIQTFPSPSSSSSPPLPSSTDLHPLSQDTVLSSQPLVSHQPDSQSHFAERTDVSPHEEDETSTSVLPEDNDNADAGLTKGDFDGSSLVPPLGKFETHSEPTRSLASEGSLLKSSLDSSTDRSSSVSAFATERRVESQTQKYKFFSPNQISFALAATQSTRLFCSIAVALFVVLSYLGFPILGSKIIRSILGFRPLYLVLLTNATVVLAQLLDKQSSARAHRRENKTQPASGCDWAEQLGKTLETGLLVQKVADAVFMDCAVYAIIVVCGLSFTR